MEILLSSMYLYVDINFSFCYFLPSLLNNPTNCFANWIFSIAIPSCHSVGCISSSIHATINTATASLWYGRKTILIPVRKNGKLVSMAISDPSMAFTGGRWDVKVEVLNCWWRFAYFEIRRGFNLVVNRASRHHQPQHHQRPSFPFGFATFIWPNVQYQSFLKIKEI